MKKMMTLAAMLFAAVSLHAGAIDWIVSGRNAIKNNAGTAVGVGQTVYLILSADESSIASALTAGTFDASTMTLGSGTTSANSNIAQTTATSSKLTAGTAYDYALLVFDGYTQTAGSSGYYKFSTSINKIANADGDHTQYVTFTASNLSANAYTSYTVTPEPTCMALLMLGVAAIALKRRV